MNSNILSFKSLRFFGAYVTPRLWRRYHWKTQRFQQQLLAAEQEQLARWLLAFHADPNLVDLRRRTPLHHAALQGICFCREICGTFSALHKKTLSKIGGAKIWSQGWCIFILNEELKNLSATIDGFFKMWQTMSIRSFFCNFRDLHFSGWAGFIPSRVWITRQKFGLSLISMSDF